MERKVRISQNKGKESENSYHKLKRSLWDRHTKTHGNCIEIFRQAQPSLSIRREEMFYNTQQRWHLKLAYQFVLSSRLSPGINRR